MTEHKPCRLEIHLLTPKIVSERPRHSDALLAYCRVQEALKAGIPDPYSTQHDLPLARWGDERDWVWRASVLHPTTEGPVFSSQQVRAYALSKLAVDKGFTWDAKKDQLSPSGGVTKAYLLTNQHQWVSKETAYLIGDIDEIRRLLTTHLTHVGKKALNGWGKIGRIEVTEDDAALERWMERTLPAGAADLATPNHHLAHGSIRAPYWDRTAWRKVLEFAA
jgi:CRISPR type IV-associated protein Csf3